MKITFNNLIDSKEEIIVFVIPTIVFDKYITDCTIHITWLCFTLNIEL